MKTEELGLTIHQSNTCNKLDSRPTSHLSMSDGILLYTYKKGESTGIKFDEILSLVLLPISCQYAESTDDRCSNIVLTVVWWRLPTKACRFSSKGLYRGCFFWVFLKFPEKPFHRTCRDRCLELPYYAFSVQGSTFS